MAASPRGDSTASTPTRRPILTRRLVGRAHAPVGFLLSFPIGLIVGMSVSGLLFAIAGERVGVQQDDVMGAGVLIGILTTALVLWTTVLGNTIEIGADGVRVWQLGRRSFYPYRDIVGGRLLMGKDRWRFELDLRGRPAARILAGALEVAAAREIIDRILEEREAYAASTLGDEIARAFDRDGRSVETWRADVTRLLGSSDYRTVRISVDDAVTTLESAAAPPALRIGAAMALTGGGIPDAAARVRGVAEASLDAKLRAALESIAADAIDARALDAALEQAPAEPRRA
jgi:hypothetical protein